MQEAILKILLSAFTLGFALTASSPFALSQSQALNGQIEGAVFDQSNAPVSHAVVKLTNLETGFVGNITTDGTGKYRFSLLPLGTYRITVEAATFKKLVREGVILSAGETATVDLPMEIGEISEVVNVLLDASIADPGKTDLGRVMNFREVQNLPLLSRNVYNFAFLQANVTGSPSRGNVPPATNANGFLRRVNYLLDGNTNTQADRAGVRLMIISDVYVNEVQLITNGFAAEFGNTPGLIMNVVTPSGTNELAGTLSYRFRRPSFYSRPFFYPAAELQPNNADYFSVAVGGPVIKDRWQFFFGHEGFTRDDKAAAARLITVLPSVRDSLISAGVPASIFPAATPSFDRSAFYIFRTDLQLNNNNRAALRFNHSNINAKNYTPAGINTLDRGFDNRSRDFALAGQLISHSSGILNEFRFQYADRITANKRNEVSGTGPSIEIRGLANFGPPENLDTVLPLQKVKQIQNNISFINGAHAIKLGGGINAISDLRQLAILSKYTFSSVAAYVNARRGVSEQHLRSYLTYSGTFGDTEIKYRSTFWNVFAQDAWKPARRLKVSYGLRYDLYVVPEADATSPLLASRKFNLDKNNLAPRLGLAYALRQGRRLLFSALGSGSTTTRRG